MTTDFVGAHDRHHADARLLENAARFSNADHLYGFAAECGLKALMTQFGMPVTGTGDPQRNLDKVHADRLWTRYSTYLSAPDTTRYQLDTENYFDDWQVADRYASDEHVTSARLTKHRDGAEHVHDLVKQARMEGLLP